MRRPISVKREHPAEPMIPKRIALASSSKELHQIVNTLSNRHPPKILPTIYPSADLSSIFIKHITNKVEKLRANILFQMKKKFQQLSQ